MAKVYKYNEDWQKLYGLKTKPEPWMHIVTESYKKDNPGTHKERVKQGLPIVMQYAVYVWDTREVIECGRVDVKNWLGLGVMTLGKRGVRAKDNGQKLKGLSDDLFLNQEFKH